MTNILNGIVFKSARIIILTLLILQLSPAQAAKRFTPMTLVSGSQPDLDLEIHNKSRELDLAKTNNLRIRLKPRVKTNQPSQSI